MTALRVVVAATALTLPATHSPIAAQSGRQVASTAEFDRFLTQVEQARQDFVSGDPASSAEINASALPFALLGGAGGIVTDAEAVNRQQVQVSNLYRDGRVTFDYVVKVVSGDMAYTVGTERRVISIGGRMEDTNLRVTQVYRKENGKWKIVVRHADPLTAYQVPTVESFRQAGQQPQTPEGAGK